MKIINDKFRNTWLACEALDATGAPADGSIPAANLAALEATALPCGRVSDFARDADSENLSDKAYVVEAGDKAYLNFNWKEMDGLPAASMRELAEKLDGDPVIDAMKLDDIRMKWRVDFIDDNMDTVLSVLSSETRRFLAMTEDWKGIFARCLGGRGSYGYDGYSVTEDEVAKIDGDLLGILMAERGKA